MFVQINLKDGFSSQMRGVNTTLAATAKNVQQNNVHIAAMDKQFASLVKNILSGAAAYQAWNVVLNQFKTGLGYVEDFNLSVASMTGFMVTFSKKASEGDFAGAFKEANEYAKELIPAIEILDTRTVATGKELKLIVETMAMYGVVLDVNNQKQKDGLVSISNALKLITKGQNQEIQMRQEIHALLTGQLRMTDRLPKLLAKQDAHLREHVAQWKAEGTLIEHVGELLEGFNVIVP
jgi:hypothetical protein